MIEKILEKLDEIEKHCLSVYDYNGHKIAVEAYEIVQKVAEEYGYGRKLNRCDTCTHYTSEEIVPPICYFCCKGIEDNYKQEGE